MKKYFKNLLGLVIAAALCLSLQAPALALHDLKTASGSIEVKTVSGTRVYSGVGVSLYKVGEASYDEDDELLFALDDALVGSGVDLGDPKLDVMNAASAIAREINRENFAVHTSGSTDEDGKLMFSDLDMGMYLVVFTGTGGHNIRINPFLVGLPCEVQSTWYTAIIATPKIRVIDPGDPDPTPTPTEVIPTDEIPRDPAETPVIEIPVDGTPRDPSLPQTGVLQWPIPVMAFFGVLLFAIGWLLNSKKKANNEA